MKRYMIFNESFDTRANILGLVINEKASPEIKEQWEEVKSQIYKEILQQHGYINRKQKVLNFTDIGYEPSSVISYHNRFYRECSASFVSENYYPALMGACALGERMLNHLILKLRNYYKTTEIYKKVYDKDSFDNWQIPIDALSQWQVISNEVKRLFQKLHKIRNDSIHFNTKLEEDVRSPSLEAIHRLKEIIELQFGSRPGGKNRDWFIRGAPGFPFIKKECEDIPFIKEFYLPSTVLVGPFHTVETTTHATMKIVDNHSYDAVGISDKEFVRLLKESRSK